MTLTTAQLAGVIDHTLLTPTATGADIRRLCEEALKAGFAAVCVNPAHVPLAHRLLKGSPVAVCTVVGFPLGATTLKAKVAEAEEAIRNGAAELDMVINIGALKEGDCEYVLAEIREVVGAATGILPEARVKVIIETGYLENEEKVAACRLIAQAGAHFVKTCTGFGPRGVTVEDVRLLRENLPPGVGVKAAGGIRTRAQALALLEAGASRIGTSAGLAIIGDPGS
ncbi:deoxyribose-phosphate aldolase [Desulfovirgula thermocuniculi]|uniref:deoxyribose-phosphate aldolase n=1 Tax=Desulfovirgula thermocuniculi TaxID=348842 RepID=UPI000418100E|nr:deoxyribose-phosphate aldolase [Desulfovirgula thermocuniculi]